jgi:hypothetical protein
MSVDLEDRVREALHGQALDVEPRGPNAEGVFERVRERRVRRRTTRAVAATLVVALIGFGALSTRGSSSTVQTGRANRPAAAVLTHPAMVTLDGWTVHYVAVIDSSITPPTIPSTNYTEYQFTDGTRQLQVSFYRLGSRTGNSTNPTEVVLRGTTGITTDEGGHRYRVDWDEQGQTWEADGGPFADMSEFLSVLGRLRVIDEATWKAGLPNGVGASILANSDKGITWYADKGVSCFDLQNSVPCN